MSTHDPERDPVDAISDDFVERYRRGELPSVTEYVEANPEYAAELREVLPAVAMMEQLKSKEESHIETLEKKSSIRGLERLGDYRIIREVGHGGMGVVYEAEQESLGRRVALKVLSPTMLNSERAVQRFHREAETVAALHHTNIVPVFGVGEDCGLHYYVMQFIEGEPLDQIIHALGEQSRVSTGGRLADTIDIHPSSASRITGGTDSPGSDSPSKNGSAVTGSLPGKAAATIADPDASPDAESTSRSGDRTAPARTDESAIRRLSHVLQTKDYWRKVAEIGVQVARALTYAHNHGVTHRDIKPSNLLVDSEACVWLVDFGLARIAEQNDLTMTGDLIGTLRYMSPEQVVGTFDHRSDLYSLGLTLYEMVTFRPAHESSIKSRVRQQMTEKAPTRPRALNPSIPVDLETIILKATAHDRANRYQSAADLADDLQRFIDGFPIRARRAGRFELLWRWSKRNPQLAISTATTLVLLIAVAAVSTWGYVSTHNAYGTLDENNKRLNKAFTDLDDAYDGLKIAEQRASDEADRAEENLGLALESFQAIVKRFSSRGAPQSLQFAIGEDENSGPVDVATVTQSEWEMIQELLRFYNDFADRNVDAPRVTAATAEAHQLIGDLHKRLGNFDEALAAYRKSKTLFERLAKADDADVSNTLNISTLENQVGLVHSMRGDFLLAFKSHEAALNHVNGLSEAVKQSSEARFVVAQTLNWMGSMGPLGAPPRGRSRGQSRRGSRPPGAQTDPPAGRPPRDGAERPNSANERPGNPAWANRGRSNPDGSNSGRVGGLKRDDLRSKAHDILTRLLEEEPGNSKYRLELARYYQNALHPFGPFRNEPGRLADLQEATDLLEQLVDQDPRNPEYRFELADTLAMTCAALQKEEAPEDAAKRFARSIELARELTNRFPHIPEYSALLSESLRKLAYTKHRQGDVQASFEPLNESVGILQQLISERPEVTLYRFTLAQTFHQMARHESESKDYEAAVESLDEAINVLEGVSGSQEMSVWIAGRMKSFMRWNKAGLLKKLGREDEAKEILEKLPRFGYNRSGSGRGGKRPAPPESGKPTSPDPDSTKPASNSDPDASVSRERTD